MTGTAGSLKKVEAVTIYDAFPRMAIFDVEYTNTGTDDLQVGGWTTNTTPLLQTAKRSNLRSGPIKAVRMKIAPIGFFLSSRASGKRTSWE